MKIVWIYYWCKYLIRTKLQRLYPKLSLTYSKRNFLEGSQVNSFISEKINSDAPFMVCRLGANESFSMRTFYFHHKKNADKAINQLCDCAGFFPKEQKYGYEFTEVMCSSIEKADLCGVLQCPLDDFFLNHFSKKSCQTMMLYSVDPVTYVKSWSWSLEGKKVLVIHPFEESIKKQYQKRELLFGDKQVLPEFELKTLKAVQTSGGQTDERFHTWFEALEYMEMEIKKIDFEVALLGCGAYGLPLAAYIKGLGKQAIHIGGGLQILFGIKGKRWDSNEKINKFYNEYWIYPSKNETPEAASLVESGCYWGE